MCRAWYPCYQKDADLEEAMNDQMTRYVKNEKGAGWDFVPVIKLWRMFSTEQRTNAKSVVISIAFCALCVVIVIRAWSRVRYQAVSNEAGELTDNELIQFELVGEPVVTSADAGSRSDALE